MKNSVLLKSGLLIAACTTILVLKVQAGNTGPDSTSSCSYFGATASCRFYPPNGGSGYVLSNCNKSGNRAVGSGGNIQTRGKCGSCVNPYDSTDVVECADAKAHVDAGE